MEQQFHNRACFLSHLGEWMVKEREFSLMSSMILSGTFPIPEKAELHKRSTGEERTVQLTNGILIVPISGMTMPKESKYGGTSTIRLRNIVNAAAHDPDVRGIMLKINSPGGYVDGNFITAQSFNKFASIKPLHSHADGMMASAAYWLGIQASRVTANPMSTVGSLGTLSVVYDMSEKFKQEGLEAIVFSTGKLKGAGTPGTKITAEQREFFQNRVDELNVFFKNAVMEARNFDQKTVDGLFDGSFGLADEAKEKGLIDEVESFEEALKALEEDITKADSGKRPNTTAPITNPIDDENENSIDGAPKTGATMNEQIKQNSEKEKESMEEIKSVAELRSAHPKFCSEIEEKAVSSALETEKARVNDWASFSDVDPKAVQAGIDSGKAISIVECSNLQSKRSNAALEKAVIDENPEDVETPPEGSDNASDEDKEVATLEANAAKYR